MSISKVSRKDAIAIIEKFMSFQYQRYIDTCRDEEFAPICNTDDIKTFCEGIPNTIDFSVEQYNSHSAVIRIKVEQESDVALLEKIVKKMRQYFATIINWNHISRERDDILFVSAQEIPIIGVYLDKFDLEYIECEVSGYPEIISFNDTCKCVLINFDINNIACTFVNH